MLSLCVLDQQSTIWAETVLKPIAVSLSKLVGVVSQWVFSVDGKPPINYC
jgi:hypothetical protein